jgi:hypothetical protein
VATLRYAFCHLGLAYLISYVLPSHHRAIALNRSFGAWEVESEKRGMLKFRLSREICLGNSNYLKVLARIKDKIRITCADPAILWGAYPPPREQASPVAAVADSVGSGDDRST